MELKLRPNRMEYIVCLLITSLMSILLLLAFGIAFQQAILEIQQANEVGWVILVTAVVIGLPLAVFLFLFAVYYMCALRVVYDVYDEEKMCHAWGKKTRFEIEYRDILYVYGQHCFLEIGCKAPYKKKGKEVNYAVGYSNKEYVCKAIEIILKANPNVEIKTERMTKK